MANEHRHHQQRGHGVHHVCDLHGATLIDQTGQQLVEHKAGADDDDAEKQHATPEHQLFTGVETVRRHFLARQQTAALEQPADIVAARQVVAQKGEKHNHQRHSKQRAGKVVHGFEHIGEPAKQREAQYRQQKELAKRHDDAGDRQNGKCERVGPVRRTLKRCKPLDLAAGFCAMQLDAALAKIKQGNGTNHDQQQSATVRDEPVVAHLAPGFARIGQARPGVLHKRLDQVACFRCLAFGQAAVACNASAHLPPHRRVVAGLHLGALGIGLARVIRLVTCVRLDRKNILALDAA